MERIQLGGASRLWVSADIYIDLLCVVKDYSMCVFNTNLQYTV